MNIESLLDQIEDIIEAGSKVPLSNKIGVDAKAIKTAIEDIRLNLPNEITQARAIVADRNNILIKAKDEAVNAVTGAQEKSRALISTAEDKVRTLVLKTEDYTKNKVAEAEAQAKQIVNTAEYELPATNLPEPRKLKTTNQLIYKNSNNPFYYSRAMGIKTGYTSAAGRCVISCAKDDGMYFLAVVCGAETSVLENGNLQMESFPECIRLFDYGFDQFSYVTAVSPLYPIAQVSVSHSAGSEAVALAPAADIEVLLPNGYDEALLVQQIELNAQTVDAPVRAGDVLGSVSVSYDGEVLGTTELLAIADVARSEISAAADNTGAYIQQNWWKWVVIVIVVIVALCAALLLALQVRKRRERLRRLEKRRRLLEQRERRQRFGGYDDDDV